MSDLFRVLARRDRLENPLRRDDGTPFTSINKLHKWQTDESHPESGNKPTENQYEQKKEQYQEKHPYQGDQPKQASSIS